MKTMYANMLCNYVNREIWHYMLCNYVNTEIWHGACLTLVRVTKMITTSHIR